MSLTAQEAGSNFGESETVASQLSLVDTGIEVDSPQSMDPEVHVDVVTDLISEMNTLTNRDEKDGKDSDLNDVELESCDSISPCETVVPSNTPVTGDSGHVSPTMEGSSDSLSDGTHPCQDVQEDDSPSFLEVVKVAADASRSIPTSSAAPGVVSSGTVTSRSSNEDVAAKTRKGEKKDAIKKSKKKEDKSVEHILRALNSLQSPEEKLAALCKKFADLHEEHRVMQTSFKTQQRTLAAVVKEKEQLGTEHTKAVMAKSTLESLCRELQKQNKDIESESMKRARESDDKRKEISAHFNATITDIQNQMTDNSEKNSLLRKENENLAEQLRAFMLQCQARDEHVKKLQEQHELENKLGAAKLTQVEVAIKEAEERHSKEKDLLILKLAELTKKAQITETQLELYKSKYHEFDSFQTTSKEALLRCKTEMDKMTKRIKKVEKDSLAWKAKWEASNKACIEQTEAKAKSQQEAALFAERLQKTESVCRALQAELRSKKTSSSSNKPETSEKSISLAKEQVPTSAAINSTEITSPTESLGCPRQLSEPVFTAPCLPVGSSEPAAAVNSSLEEKSSKDQLGESASKDSSVGEKLTGGGSLAASSSSSSSVNGNIGQESVSAVECQEQRLDPDISSPVASGALSSQSAETEVTTVEVKEVTKVEVKVLPSQQLDKQEELTLDTLSLCDESISQAVTHSVAPSEPV